MQHNIVITFMQLSGWRRVTAAFVCGVCLAATMPPLHFLPFIIPAFTGLLVLLEGAGSPRAAFRDGWWFGCGFFISGIYWISISLLTDPERFAWLIPFAIFGLSGILAIYCGIAAWGTHFVSLRGAGKVIFFAVIWSVTEWLRGHLFTGFPWNLSGYAWSFADAPMQIVSVTGIYGLSLLTVTLAAMPAAVILAPADRINREKRAFWITLLIAVAIIGWGQWRVATTPIPVEPKVKLRLVQGNIPQELKWDSAQKHNNLRHYMDMTLSAGYDEITHVIWPESSIPFLLEEESVLAQKVGGLAPVGGALITGAVRADNKFHNIYNSLQALDRAGKFLSGYAKHRLVPFGEFVPFRNLLPFNKITHGSQDFSRGSGPKTLRVEGLPPFSPLICYEAVFPELAVNRAVDGDGEQPAWLLNITNDAWFGNSSGPYQHFHIARTRTIEQGVPMVRLAGSGISAIIDPLGQVLMKTNLNETVVLDGHLPQKLPTPTLYNRYQDTIFLLMGYILVLCTIIVQKKGYS